MALKMVISSIGVTVDNGANFTRSQILPEGVTLNIPDTANGGLVMQPGVFMEGLVNSKANGYMHLELFDSTGTSVLEVSQHAKIGYNNSYGSMQAGVLGQIWLGATESVAETEYQGFKNLIATLSPTNYSTGRILVSFSGNIPRGASLSVGNSVAQDPAYPLISTCGILTALPMAAGHAQIEVEFSIVTV